MSIGGSRARVIVKGFLCFIKVSQGLIPHTLFHIQTRPRVAPKRPQCDRPSSLRFPPPRSSVAAACSILPAQFAKPFHLMSPTGFREGFRCALEVINCMLVRTLSKVYVPQRVKGAFQVPVFPKRNSRLAKPVRTAVCS